MPRSEDDQVRGGGPRMQDSYTPVAADDTAAHDRLRLVPTATLGVSERLAGRLDGTWPGSLSTCVRAAGRLDGGRLGRHGRADAGRASRRHGQPPGNRWLTRGVNPRRAGCCEVARPVRRPGRETDRSKDQHRAPARLNTLVSAAHAFVTFQRLDQNQPRRPDHLPGIA
jgi:hypothetical protein